MFETVTRLYNAALQSPGASVPAALNRLVAGQAKIAYDQSLSDERSRGSAFRGTPPVNRLVVKAMNLSAAVPSVTLENCVLLSTSDPWTEYVVATGKAAPKTATPKVPPPYPTTIRLFKPTSAGWVVTSFTTDATRTCSR